MIRDLATATLEKPPEHSGTVSCPALSPGIKPPPNCATSVKVCGSPPWSTATTGVPFLLLRVSGSKSQPGSGVPAPALANKSDIVVAYPSAARATLAQKFGPSAALKVLGSHSSKATTCAGLVEFPAL